jgi:hypothetical protein
MDVMQTLGELGVSLPTSEENVKVTVEELKGKLTYFKENQDRVTKEVSSPIPPKAPLIVTTLAVVSSFLWRLFGVLLLRGVMATHANDRTSRK